MAVTVGDRIAILNIWLRDIQAQGARVFNVTQTDNGWLVEFMGEPVDEQS